MGMMTMTSEWLVRINHAWWNVVDDSGLRGRLDSMSRLSKTMPSTFDWRLGTQSINIPLFVAPYADHPGVASPFTPLPVTLKMCDLCPFCSFMTLMAALVQSKTPMRLHPTTPAKFSGVCSHSGILPPFLPALLIQMST